jgi:hypothetical protein
MLFDILQIEGQRVISWVLVVNVASPMRGQISMTFLACCYFILPTQVSRSFDTW